MDYVLGLGANLGSRENQLQAGLELLAGTQVCRIVATSDVFESEPVGPPQPRYLNAAARVQSELPPHALLSALLEVERMLGRERRERWGARTLDLDILWAERTVDSPSLRVPHPRLRERGFALLPLLQVAPELAGEYGALARAHAEDGGRRLHVLALPPRAQLQRSERELCVRGHGLDLADALAAACSAAGRALWPELEHHAGPPALALLRVESEQPAAALPAALHARAASGHAFQRVLVTACDASALHARVLGREQPSAIPGELAPPLVEVGNEGGETWVELRFGASRGLPPRAVAV